MPTGTPHLARYRRPGGRPAERQGGRGDGACGAVRAAAAAGRWPGVGRTAPGGTSADLGRGAQLQGGRGQPVLGMVTPRSVLAMRLGLFSPAASRTRSRFCTRCSALWTERRRRGARTPLNGRTGCCGTAARIRLTTPTGRPPPLHRRHHRHRQQPRPHPAQTRHTPPPHPYLHQRTVGRIGSLTRLIRQTAITAIHDGTEPITKQSLDAVQLDHLAETHHHPRTRTRYPQHKRTPPPGSRHTRSTCPVGGELRKQAAPQARGAHLRSHLPAHPCTQPCSAHCSTLSVTTS